MSRNKQVVCQDCTQSPKYCRCDEENIEQRNQETPIVKIEEEWMQTVKWDKEQSRQLRAILGGSNED